MAMPMPADSKLPVHLRAVAGAQSRVIKVGNMTRDAASSGSWSYPIWGVVYLLTHPGLLRPVAPLLIKALLVSAGVVAGCFFFLYLPQVAWLALFTGPLDEDNERSTFWTVIAFIGAVPLVLSEAALILAFLGKTFLLGQLDTDLFDAVLVEKGNVSLVERARPVVRSKNNVRQLGRVITKPLNNLSLSNLVRYLVTFPLNMVPIVGTVVFLFYNGYKSGPTYHARYFQLKGWDKQKRSVFVENRRGAYTAFGVTAALFNLVPVVSILLNLACQVGAALWASDMETKNKEQRAEFVASNPQVVVALPPQKF